MKKTIIIFFCAVIIACLLCACSETYCTDDLTLYLHPFTDEDILPKVELTQVGFNWRVNMVEEFLSSFSYYSSEPSSEELEKQVSNYIQNSPKINNPAPNEEYLLKMAMSQNKYSRLAVAQNKECPDELLVWIASKEPDPVIRADAIGNVLSRKNFPVKYLLEMAQSAYTESRYAAICHDNRTSDIISLLLDDPDSAVCAEAWYAFNATA